MKIGGFVSAGTFGDISCGTAFYFHHADKTFIGMKIGRDKTEACAVLSGFETPTAFDGDALKSKRLLLLPDLAFTPCDDVSAYDFGAGTEDETPGLLFLNGTEKILRIATGKGHTTLIDVAGGELGVDLHPRSIACRKWSLVQMMDGVPRVLHSHGA